MTRRTAIAALLTPAIAAASPLFDGPKMHRRCVIGALDGGMRFRPTNDRAEEWVIVRDVATVTTKKEGGWYRVIGRAAVELHTGELKLWEWETEVIRTL